MEKLFKKQVALPQDHGSWVFILSPMAIGLFAGGRFNIASLYFLIAGMSAFLIRQPLTIAIKAYSGRRPKTDLLPAGFWILIYSLLCLLSLILLFSDGYGYLLYLAVPGLLVFLWHLWLVSRRSERRQINIEVIATGVLSLAAPAAYWTGIEQYSSTGWWLWIFTWLQSAASIVYAYLRLEQREIILEKSAELPQTTKWRMGSRALIYTTFNLLFSLIAGMAILPSKFIFMPFLLQWLETLWGITHPAIGWKPTKIGIRQLFVSILWTVLFILVWSSS